MPFHLDAENLLATFSRPFPKVDFWIHFVRPFALFWLPFGALGLHFGALGLPLAPFWLPLVHFWFPLAHFWLPLAHFWLTFGVFWLTFTVSWSLFSYFYVFSTKMTCKIIFLYNSDENLMQYLEGLPSFAEHPHPPGPERNPGCASFD